MDPPTPSEGSPDAPPQTIVARSPRDYAIPFSVGAVAAALLLTFGISMLFSDQPWGWLIGLIIIGATAYGGVRLYRRK